ncbi:hypothetical protein TNCV_3290211 [Trichonephila clavipes]|nr:hypothetical protein TNCV_3290211 [Trichonephila clavipes]
MLNLVGLDLAFADQMASVTTTICMPSPRFERRPCGTLDASCHTTWHRVIRHPDGLPCGISCQICSNYWARTSTFPGRCSHLPIISQTRSIEERSDNLAGQGSVWQAVRQFIATRAAWSGLIF